MSENEYISTPNFGLSDDLLAIKSLAESFANTEIRPYALHYDESQEFPHEIFAKLGELGFLGILVPTEYGGSGLGYQEYAIIVEAIANACPSIALGVAAHNGLCTNHILKFANEEVKQKYIPRLAKGETMGAWGLTEPSAGSDAGGTQTTAIRDGDYYIINGSKNFITHGNVGDIAVIMAVTDASKGKKGISAFAIDKSMPGFYASKKENKLGMRCSDTASLTFDNVRVPVDQQTADLRQESVVLPPEIDVYGREDEYGNRFCFTYRPFLKESEKDPKEEPEEEENKPVLPKRYAVITSNPVYLESVASSTPLKEGGGDQEEYNADSETKSTEDIDSESFKKLAAPVIYFVANNEYTDSKPVVMWGIKQSSQFVAL